MPTSTLPHQPPFDDAAAAALAHQLRAAARACDTARLVLLRSRADVATSWRGPAADDALDRAARIIADLERAAAGCSRRGRWVEALRADVAATVPHPSTGIHLPVGFTLEPAFAPVAAGGAPR